MLLKKKDEQKIININQYTWTKIKEAIKNYFNTFVHHTRLDGGGVSYGVSPDDRGAAWDDYCYLDLGIHASGILSWSPIQANTFTPI